MHGARLGLLVEKERLEKPVDKPTPLAWKRVCIYPVVGRNQVTREELQVFLFSFLGNYTILNQGA